MSLIVSNYRSYIYVALFELHLCSFYKILFQLHYALGGPPKAGMQIEIGSNAKCSARVRPAYVALLCRMMLLVTAHVNDYNIFSHNNNINRFKVFAQWDPKLNFNQKSMSAFVDASLFSELRIMNSFFIYIKFFEPYFFVFVRKLNYLLLCH